MSVTPEYAARATERHQKKTWRNALKLAEQVIDKALCRGVQTVGEHQMCPATWLTRDEKRRIEGIMVGIYSSQGWIVHAKLVHFDEIEDSRDALTFTPGKAPPHQIGDVGK